jgi:APA family basic amino acid/polyamine antiporter
MPDHLPLKPGNRVFRPRRIKKFRLRRVLGIPAVFSAGYGNVGSSIYYALGIVAMAAMGATPVALGIAGILFIFTALTYAEGTAAIPEAGGSAVLPPCLRGYGRLPRGWALMLSYIVTISISAYTIPPYLGFFWEPFKTSPVIVPLPPSASSFS